jgi:adenosylmethionine-8-amino-7-oxononanoate aminotransferase
MNAIVRKFPNDPLPNNVVSSDGMSLHLDDGRWILDVTAGWTSFAVLGYRHTEIENAIQQ